MTDEVVDLAAMRAEIGRAELSRLDAEARNLAGEIAAKQQIVERLDAQNRAIQVPGWRNPMKPPAFAETRLTVAELESADLAPRCFVRDYLYADVAVLAAPGGSGKTTLMLYEMTCMALGRPVHGLQADAKGWWLFITSEDQRARLAARLREIMRAMNLTDDERDTVLDRVRFWDVTGEQVRLVQCGDGNIILTSLADNIVDAYRGNPPIGVVFDPLVSFGASEGQINDNEQAIITAARRIIRAFDCCVRLIAHVGKANAREKSLDQYSSRGGSALPDGSRMVAVLQAWDDADKDRPPAGCTVSTDASIAILARPKLSYSPPNLPKIWLRRTGFRFESFIEYRATKAESQRANADQVVRFIESQIKQGRKHTKNTLEASVPNMTRNDFRAALTELVVSNRIVELDLPAAERQGRRKTYLAPAEYGGLAQAPIGKPPVETGFYYSAAHKEGTGGGIEPPVLPRSLESAGIDRRNTAELAECGASDPTGDIEP